MPFSRKIRHALLPLLALGAMGAIGAGAASASVVPIGDPVKVATGGGEGGPALGNASPEVALNTQRGEHLTVWASFTEDPSEENALFGRVMSLDGTPVSERFRITPPGREGLSEIRVSAFKVAYNSTDDEYLIAWSGKVVRAYGFTTGGGPVRAMRISAEGEPLTGPVPVSTGRPEGVVVENARLGDVVFNSRHNEYFVTWSAAVGSRSDEREVFGARLTASLSPSPSSRLSSMGPDGDPDFEAHARGIAYNAEADEYLVTWSGDDDTGRLVEDEFEVYARRAGRLGAPLAPTSRISEVGEDGRPTRFPTDVAVAYDTRENSYMVAWEGYGSWPSTTRDTGIFLRAVDADSSPRGPDRRVSPNRPEDGPGHWGQGPRVTYNELAGEHLVSWSGIDGSHQTFAKRVTPSGRDAAPQARLTSEGALDHAAAVNPADGTYLFVWFRNDEVRPGVDPTEATVLARQYANRIALPEEVDIACAVNPINPKCEGSPLRPRLPGLPR